ncbi:Putative NADPH-quinone reductase [Erythrobacter litoralis]|jgi:putative NADPH-quinone reductase|uniref:Dehydrogenase n=1 Tax=Erythrobacter litoralis TaxID=39960 RepID=A0A074MNN9_9SPHN|nr:NAD(P)H-dependent oxidoreductase [Erythrobacter litoralis]AOL24289.1 Putative NADPH-quinone reductase [Erythrobacter litoralis]KEO93468.1 dehydrogenase [Erythrobacter litoralis]MEE4338961.1 NAD(P)H-dependent oxidoreductase [Erythrobacter sp.]
MARITIIDGHPDPDPDRFVHALARTYADAARVSHEVRDVEIAALDFPLLRDPAQWRNGKVPPGLEQVQRDIEWAEHLVFLYPLWLGDVPALFKGFLEQVLRPGFAIQPKEGGLFGKLLLGKSARVIVTMGMPAAGYRLYFFSHSLRSLKRNMLHFVGISPVRMTLIGSVEDADARARGLRKVGDLGRRGR